MDPEISRASFRKSPTVGKIGAALVRAQKVMRHAQADSENPHFKSHYADLESVIDAVKDPLADQEIARTQFLVTGPQGEAGVVTCLIHSSGEWLEAEVYCKPTQPGPQPFGSVVTYLRRYSLAAAAGLAQTDDDANAAQAPSKPARRDRSPDKLTLAQHTEMQILRKELQIGEEAWRAKLEAYFPGKHSSQDLTPSEAERWLDLLRKTKLSRTSPPSETPLTTSTSKST